MSAESAHLSTFGAETETEAEIRSTSKFSKYNYSGLMIKLILGGLKYHVYCTRVTF